MKRQCTSFFNLKENIEVSLKALTLFFFTFVQLTCFSQTTYYISNKGNDKNDGLSSKRPIKTIVRMMRGSKYLLKRGDTFYFKINASETFNGLIKIDAYGKGKKPVVSLYKNIKSTSWTLFSKSIWKVDLKNSDNYSGYTNADDTNVGFVKIGSSIKGNKVNSIDKLKVRWDFYSDSQFLYVFSTKNPSYLNEHIRITTRDNIVQLGSNMQVSNISLIGTGGHAIQGSDRSNVVIKNVTISEIGGSYLPGFKRGDTRFGNGIEILGKGSNYTIEGCYVSQVYDAAYTIQSTGSDACFENIVFKNNVAENNEQSFEFWTSNRRGGFKNCWFISNHCLNAGFGWSHSVRPDKDVGVHILNYYSAFSNNDITISQNIFKRAKTGYIYLDADTTKVIMFKSDRNRIFLDENVPIRTNDASYPISKSEKFIKSFGIELGSVFKHISN